MRLKMSIKKVPVVYFAPHVLVLHHDAGVIDEIATSLCDTISLESFDTFEDLKERILKEKNIESIMDACFDDCLESESDHCVIELDYKKLAQNLLSHYRQHEFTSTVAFSFSSDLLNGYIDSLRFLIDLPVGRIAISDAITLLQMQVLYESGLIHRYIDSSQEEISDTLESTIISLHHQVIDTLNHDVFGVVLQHSLFKELFEHQPFVQYVLSVFNKNKIIFSCVFENEGSLLMMNQSGDSFLLNVYWQDRLQDVFFASSLFEDSLDDDEQEGCLNFTCLFDYKTIDINDNSIDSLCLDFESFELSATKVMSVVTPLNSR